VSAVPAVDAREARAGARARIGLAFDGGRIAVSSDDAQELRRLQEFFDCGFEDAPSLACERSVDVVVDPDAFDRLAPVAAPSEGPLVEGFAGDVSSVMLRRLAPDGPREVYLDPRGALLLVVSADGARVEIVVRERTRALFTPLMRTVRELAMARTVATGGVLVHGAAVLAGRGSIVLSGPKRSGKTTLLMALLLEGGVAYVANDRCVLRPDGAGASVLGLPTIVSVRRDSLERFPSARARLAGIRPEVAAAWDAAPSTESDVAADRASAGMSPPELRRLLGAPACASGGPVAGLVFPRIEGGPSRLTMRRLGAEEALRRFEQGLFRAGHASPLGEVLLPRASGDLRSVAREAAARMGRRVAAEVPCFDCALGGDGPPSAEECRALVEAVSEAGLRAERRS